jgi:hypothetical protein
VENSLAAALISSRYFGSTIRSYSRNVLSIGSSSCTPQKHHAISRGNFFQPIFMVQPAENILASEPAGSWQLMPPKFRSREWFPTEIGNTRP